MADTPSKKAARLEAREKRRAAQTEVTASKLRTTAGFFGAYIATQAFLPSISPGIAANQAALDAVLGLGGGIVAIANQGPIGDVALGVALVGGIQTADNIGARIQAWRAGMAATGG